MSLLERVSLSFETSAYDYELSSCLKDDIPSEPYAGRPERVPLKTVPGARWARRGMPGFG